MSQLRQLHALITQSLEVLEKSSAESGNKIPEIDEPFHASSEAFRRNPIAEEAASIICAAALQMNATLSAPKASVYEILGGHWKAAAVRMCLEAHVADILREAGPEGLHVSEIAAKTGVDAQKLGRCLRMLATCHIFKEVRPEVFTNTRISSLLDTAKSSKDIIADPGHKYDGTNGIAATLGHNLDEHFKAAAYQWETVCDPEMASSDDPDKAAFVKAVGNETSLWEYLDQPEHAYNQRRYNISMLGVAALLTNDVSLTGFDWKSLPENALVVDVGGGVGAATLPLAKTYPNLRFVIQDRPGVVENGIKVWAQELPEALASERVKLQVHNFFNPQPQTDASVFFLKHILHDWSDEYCIKILERLRASATPKTKLVVVEFLVPYACHDPNGATSIPGAVPREAPAPLLANWGGVNLALYDLDLAMMMTVNAQERTIYHFDKLLKSAGWKITIVHRATSIDAASTAAFEAVPI